MKILFLVLLLISQLAVSAETKKVCATYKNSNKSYLVDAQILSGMELAKATYNFQYNALSKYVVIFWGQGEASVIELDLPFDINVFGSTGKDQKGYPWSISSNTSFCF